MDTAMSEAKHFKARVGFGRFTGAGVGWRLVVEDDASHQTVCVVEMTDEALGKALGNFFDGSTSEGTVYDTSRVGLRHENMTVRVPFEDTPKGRNLDALRIVAETQNPGWTADRDERWNSHRSDGKTYAFTLRRWVAP